MKKNILIVVALLVALIFAFYTSHSQARQTVIKSFKEVKLAGPDSLPNNDTILLADETTLNYTKTEAKIHCSNETIFNAIFKTHGTLFKRFTCTWKTDRNGRYKDYVIYLNKEDAQIIRAFILKSF